MTESHLQLSSDPIGNHDPHIVEKTRSFAREHIAPHAENWERGGIYPLETIRQASLDFGGFLVAEELGGKGASVTDFLLMVEEMAKVDIAFTLAFIVHSNATFIISQSPNAALRDRLLQPLIVGERIGAFCLTEPAAGSDAAAITTLALTKGDEVVVNGKKAWVTAGAAADDLVVFAKTEEGGSARTVACYALEANQDGVTRGMPYQMISGHVTQTSDVTFEDVRTSRKSTLFEAGMAFKAAMNCLDAARLGIAAMCNGALAGGLAKSINYAGTRKMFGSTTLHHQGIQWAFAEHLTRLEASRALMFQAAMLAENEEPTTLAAAHAKKFATYAASEGLVWAMRAMGAAGTLRDHGLARQLGSAQLLFDTDGTAEIMNVLIGRSLRQ